MSAGINGALGTLFMGAIPDRIDPEVTGVLYPEAGQAFCLPEQKAELETVLVEMHRLGVPQDRRDALLRAEGIEHSVALLTHRGVPESPQLVLWRRWICLLDSFTVPLLARLTDGSLRAFGDPEQAGAAPHWIAPRLWRVLRPDKKWYRKMTGGGATFWNVRVVEPEAILATLGGQLASRPPLTSPSRQADDADIITALRRVYDTSDHAPNLSEVWPLVKENLLNSGLYATKARVQNAAEADEFAKQRLKAGQHRGR